MDDLTSRLQTIKTSGSPISSPDCVLYVMSRDQRVQDNHALAAAQQRALEQGLPLVVVFYLQLHVGYRAKEHYQFMIDGLRSVQADLQAKNIQFVLMTSFDGSLSEQISNAYRPAAVYFDFSPLRGARNRVSHVASQLQSDVFVVDTHNCVPMWHASDKEEYAAHTFRPKIHAKLAAFLHEPPNIIRHPHGSSVAQQDIMSVAKPVLAQIAPSGISVAIKASEHEANAALHAWLSTGLSDYATGRNDPTQDAQSGLSPYLHYGHMSALRVALEIQKKLKDLGAELHILTSATMPNDSSGKSAYEVGANALIEELVVRKELADNYCYYASSYTDMNGARTWAIRSLNAHINDERDFIYTFEQFNDALTHDPAWNAAQMQLRRTGKMHGYMRMYWAKKILEWTALPDDAIKIAIRLNDTYSLDGGDPNGYAGIMWSIAGVHDRPWVERSVFGAIRYMNYAGLKRKFNIAGYESTWLT